MFTLVGHMVSSLIWGILLASLLIGIIQFIVKVIFSPYAHSVSSLAIVSVAFCMLSWQTVQMIGAFRLKGYVDNVEETVNAIIPAEGITVTPGQIQEVERQLNQWQSVLGSKFTVDMQEYLVQYKAGAHIDRLQVIDSVKNGFRHTINWFIWKRLFWIVGIMLVSTVFAGLLGSQGAGGTTSSRRRGTRASRSSRSTSSSARRRHREY